MADYEVRLTIMVDDVDSYAAAAKEAWAQIIQTIVEGNGATVVMVTPDTDCPDGEHDHSAVLFDMSTPWRPEILDSRGVDVKSNEVWSETDALEAEMFQKKYDEFTKKKGSVLEGLFNGLVNDGGLAN